MSGETSFIKNKCSSTLYKEEFDKLSLDYGKNVTFLRDKIDHASQQFSQIRKHFIIAEKKYLECKTQLWKVQNEKEILETQLQYIIEQYEIEKSKKLSQMIENGQFGQASIMQVQMYVDTHTKQELQKKFKHLCIASND